MTDSLERQLAAIKASRRRILDAAAADRRALERTLHDGLQQDLVAVSANLQLLSKHLGSSAVADELASDLKKAMGDAQRHAAELAEMLYPPLLEARGLASAIRAAAGHRGVVARVEVQGAGPYPAETVEGLYWSCVEVLAATPPGSELSISVAGDGAMASFEVGASAPFVEQKLERLRDRVEALGGAVSVRRQSDGRTGLYGTLPLSV